MSNLKILYFIKYFEQDFMEYFRKIRDKKSIFIFDLEDSIQDVLSPDKNEKLKEKYRKILTKLLVNNQEIYQNSKIGIRINGIHSAEFKKDIQLLTELKIVNWETIILPKIESRQEILQLQEVLDLNAIKYESITIIAETKKGVDSLHEIASPQIKKLKYVIFGHADYNADEQIFPFVHQNNDRYWTWVEGIVKHLEGTELVFVNSPCLFLEEQSFFKSMLNKLSQITSVEIGQVTLTHQQSKMCFNHVATNEIHFPYAQSTETDPIHFAKTIVDHLKIKNTDKSFMIDDKNYLICPHEISLAQKLLHSKAS